MKTKFLIPVLAIIFAVGMSFTTVNMGDKAAFDYYLLNNQWEEIPMIDCGIGSLKCRVELSDGTIHKVYDTKNLNSLKETSSEFPFEL